jgi:hypothetical protein
VGSPKIIGYSEKANEFRGFLIGIQTLYKPSRSGNILQTGSPRCPQRSGFILALLGSITLVCVHLPTHLDVSKFGWKTKENLMPKKIALLGLALCGFTVMPLIAPSSLTAHQQQQASDVQTMIHLDPNDSPIVGKPTLTWFMLKRSNGDMIDPANCNCKITAYDANKKAIARHFPISTMQMEGHEQGHKALRTTIIFPKRGSYTVVLSGQSRDKSFAPFELTFPVQVKS